MSIQTVGRVYDGKFLSCKSVSDDEGWIDAKRYIPPDLTLVDLLILGKDNTYKGWINMRKWDGLKVKENDNVTHWKPIPSAEQARRSRKNTG